MPCPYKSTPSTTTALSGVETQNIASPRRHHRRHFQRHIQRHLRRHFQRPHNNRIICVETQNIASLQIDDSCNLREINHKKSMFFHFSQQKNHKQKSFKDSPIHIFRKKISQKILSVQKKVLPLRLKIGCELRRIRY
jgi:hypothetical protein